MRSGPSLGISSGTVDFLSGGISLSVNFGLKYWQHWWLVASSGIWVTVARG